MLTIDDYKRWLASFEALDLPAISTDTSARILAVTCVLGNNEFMVMNQKYKADVDYICRRFHIEGGESPSIEIVAPLREYIGELQKATELPKWAERLFKERYDMKIYL